MVPRSYLYSSSPTPVFSARNNMKQNMVTTNKDQTASRTSAKKDKTTKLAKPPSMVTPPPATASKPVVIPTRARNAGQRKSKESIYRDRRASEDAGGPHISLSTFSSIAALHAITPPLDSQQSFISENRRKESTRHAIGKSRIGNRGELPRRAVSSSSPQSWGMLLSPPEESGQESCSFESDMTLGPLSPVRSISTESMPSLETDNESLSSNSNLTTPGQVGSGRSSGDRKLKILSTSKSEDCFLDHPLLPEPSKQNLRGRSDQELQEFLSPAPKPFAKSKSSFRSNLTASFRALRSAAKSFSDFTAPAVQRDDYLTRSLLSISPQFTDERRPLPLAEPPDPALRRYLNPVTFSPSDFHFHTEQESSQTMRPNCTASIQLQPYQQSPQRSDKATSPPVFPSQQHPFPNDILEENDNAVKASLQRQREPRENSDFLRVIVLEMNMRKVGKLSDGSPGKARLWLPARQTGKILGNEDGRGEKGVPKRWTGMTA
ncbi:hypothetical protein MMC28_004014 [Mycoblastus sanguinarius]|nr:hypothetical protein [Mycoblastus sanguinarius]